MAQKQANIWYFGYHAGITFNSGTPVALPAGVMDASEGCTSICDANGNLLFYSNGSVVYDKSDKVMPNGYGLLGGASSSMSAYIAPKINSTNKYYIFTVDGYSTLSWRGLSYSIIDMSLKGNGTTTSFFGDVKTKNVRLTDSTVEKLAAAMHANGKDYWMITRKNFKDHYYAYHVTCSGVDSVPVVTKFTGTSLSYASGVGYLKVSQDGKCLVNVSTDGIQIYDFDNATGVLSNPQRISHGFSDQLYGVAFSPNDSILYCSEAKNGFSDNRIYYYKRFTTNISSTEAIINTDSVQPWAMQLAPDGKIYIAQTGSIMSRVSVLNNPNSFANPGFTKTAVQLTTGTSSAWGLPNIFEAYWHNPIPVNTPEKIDTSICKGQSVQVSLSNDSADYHYLWSPDKNITNASIANPVISATASVLYTRMVIDKCSNDMIMIDSIYIAVSGSFTVIATDSIACAGEVVGVQIEGAVNSYLWSPGGETTPSATTIDPGIYKIKIASSCTETEISFNVINCDESLYKIFFSSAFTPNNDGLNDTFIPIYESRNEIETFEMHIYNRWGDLVFESNDPGNGWDGKNNSQPAESGVYIVAGNYLLENSGEKEFFKLKTCLLR